jgi:hypothetical protein
MAKITVAKAASNWVTAKKKLTSHDKGKLTAEKKAELESSINAAEAILLNTVGGLIGKTVTAAARVPVTHHPKDIVTSGVIPSKQVHSPPTINTPKK